jgi:hypothetical protein
LVSILPFGCSFDSSCAARHNSHTCSCMLEAVHFERLQDQLNMNVFSQKDGG